MRLISKALLWYLLLAVVVFGLGGIITFVLVKDAVEKETDYELSRNLRQIQRAIEKGQPTDLLENEMVKIYPLNQAPVEEDRFYSDTLVYHARTERMENFRKLVAFRNVEERPYKIEIIDIYFEQDDIIEVVSQILLRLFVIFSLVLLLGSFLISRFIFRPFEELLASIDRWSLKSNTPLKIPKTSTKELQKLNEFLKRMTNKARHDYQSLKEFTENASHEMQTPLAIAKGKLEILQEDPSLTVEQLQLIQSAQFSLDKLSKLGKALTLLTKIENLEFETTDHTNISEVAQRISRQFEELANMKGLRLQKHIHPDVKLQIDPLLADIMITNLLKNALQHNIKDGRIEIELDEHQLCVKNTGPEPQGPMDELFKRFKKSNGSNGTLGLGLAIVKKIGDVHQMKVEYNFEEGLHKVKVQF
jgi:signal transduction histidine kinase